MLLVGCDTVLWAITVLSIVKVTDPLRGGVTEKKLGCGMVDCDTVVETT